MNPNSSKPAKSAYKRLSDDELLRAIGGLRSPEPYVRELARRYKALINNLKMDGMN